MCCVPPKPSFDGSLDMICCEFELLWDCESLYLVPPRFRAMLAMSCPEEKPNDSLRLDSSGGTSNLPLVLGL
jgi:hypothetical protein